VQASVQDKSSTFGTAITRSTVRFVLAQPVRRN